MRVLIALALLPPFAQAEELQFSVTGDLFQTGPPGVTSTWNGPVSFPSTFTMSFLVNTLDQANTLTDVGFDPLTGVLDQATFSVVASDFTVTLDGKTIQSDGSGAFEASGTGLGMCSYIGGDYGAQTSVAGFGGIPDFSFGGGCITHSQLLNSKDPLGLLLNGSSFFTDNGGRPTFLGVYDSQLISIVTVSATQVPEPATLGLMALGFAGVGFVRRRRKD
jgi:hypothetical protein